MVAFYIDAVHSVTFSHTLHIDVSGHLKTLKICLRSAVMEEIKIKQGKFNFFWERYKCNLRGSPKLWLPVTPTITIVCKKNSSVFCLVVTKKMSANVAVPYPGNLFLLLNVIELVTKFSTTLSPLCGFQQTEGDKRASIISVLFVILPIRLTEEGLMWNFLIWNKYFNMRLKGISHHLWVN